MLAELDVELASKMLGMDAPSKAPPSEWGRLPPRRKKETLMDSFPNLRSKLNV